MNFNILAIEVTELVADSAWNSHLEVDLDFSTGEILFHKDYKIDNNFKYELNLKYYEQYLGNQNKKEYLDEKENKLFLSYDLLKFLKIHLLKDKVENNLVLKNIKDKKLKI